MKRTKISGLFSVIILLMISVVSNVEGQSERKRVLDGDTVWKQQCSRCHLTPSTIPKNKMLTTVRHMRDVAQLTDREYRLLVEFVKK